MNSHFPILLRQLLTSKKAASLFAQNLYSLLTGKSKPRLIDSTHSIGEINSSSDFLRSDNPSIWFNLPRVVLIHKIVGLRSIVVIGL